MNELKGRPIPQTSKQVHADNRTSTDELKVLATPLVEWIRKNHGYNTEVHITADFVSVKHDGVSLPFPITEV